MRRFAVNIIRSHRESPTKVSISKVLQGIRRHKVPALRRDATRWDQIIERNLYYSTIIIR